MLPIPNGRTVHGKQFRQISLEEMELNTASFHVVPDGSWLGRTRNGPGANLVDQQQIQYLQVISRAARHAITDTEVHADASRASLRRHAELPTPRWPAQPDKHLATTPTLR